MILSKEYHRGPILAVAFDDGQESESADDNEENVTGEDRLILFALFLLMLLYLFDYYDHYDGYCYSGVATFTSTLRMMFGGDDYH